MLCRLPHILVALAAIVALALPSAAAASGRDVIRDCADDGVIDGDYSQEEYREAEEDLPSDIDEYTDCREAIRAAQASGGDRGGRRGDGSGGAGGAGGGPGDPSLTTSEGAVAGSREDLAELDRIADGSRRGDAPALRVDGRTITPGEAGGGELLGVARTANDLPGPVLALLVLVALALLGGTALMLRRQGLAGALGGRLGGRIGGLSRLAPNLDRVSPRRFLKR